MLYKCYTRPIKVSYCTTISTYTIVNMKKNIFISISINILIKININTSGTVCINTVITSIMTFGKNINIIIDIGINVFSTVIIIKPVAVNTSIVHNDICTTNMNIIIGPNN